MKDSRKLNNFSSFLSYHPMCQLGINSLLIVKNKCSLVVMFIKFGVNSIPFFHIKPNILQSFLMTYMFTKIIPFTNNKFILPFYLNTNPTFNNVQVSIFPYKQFSPWEFYNPFVLELSCGVIILLLNSYLRWNGHIIFRVGGRPIQ